MSSGVQKYYLKRNSLASENGCLFYGERIVIPSGMREEVLKLLHEQHIGVVRSKALARTVVWWPGIDQDIEDYNAKCHQCQSTRKSKPANLLQWTEVTYPFERVHIDFCSLNGQQILIIYDAYSKWMEAISLNSTTATIVIGKLRTMFSIFGLPTYIVSDNGPPFSSKEFVEFCKSNGITVLKSPPYHPQSNGSAERAVQTFKDGLRKSLLDSKERKTPLQIRIDRFLLKYRTTPTLSTGLTPADMIFQYKPRTLFTTLNFNKPDSAFGKIQSQSKRGVGQGLPCFKEGEEVWYRNVHSNLVRWVKGKVIRKLSSCRYMVLINGALIQAHTDQIRSYSFRARDIMLVPSGVSEDAERGSSDDREDRRIVTRSMARKMKM